jgi:hypothetical protein
MNWNWNWWSLKLISGVVLTVDHATININNRKSRSFENRSKYRGDINSGVVWRRNSTVLYSAISDERSRIALKAQWSPWQCRKVVVRAFEKKYSSVQASFTRSIGAKETPHNLRTSAMTNKGVHSAIVLRFHGAPVALELLQRPYCDPTALLSECRVTAFVLSMLKMRAVGRRSMRCHCNAAAMLRRCLRSYCAHLGWERRPSVTGVLVKDAKILLRFVYISITSIRLKVSDKILFNVILENKHKYFSEVITR